MTMIRISAERRVDQALRRSELRAYLQALAGPAMPGSLFEIRERHGQLMRRRFVPVEQPDQAVSAILRAARERDVYLGAAPRSRPHGGRAAIAGLSSLWVDADTPEAIARLQAFEPEPSILIASGRGQHAYWLLDHVVDVVSGENANRRLARHLTADEGCADAARILRPPHTCNHKQAPPRPVAPLWLRTDRRVPLAAITTDLPATPEPSRFGRSERNGRSDPLLALEPAFYVTALLEMEIGRDRKVSCPFHLDEHPSLHVYPTAAQGWHCFSCQRGGSIYDLAAAVWDLDTRGVEFVRLRALLHRRLLGRGAA
jgi:hypothetical protein